MLEVQNWMTMSTDKHDNVEYVYLYFYPSYADLAYINEVTQWPCKIGRTTQDPRIRVMQQLNSCAPELPELACVFQCDNSRALETTIHNYMKLHNRYLNHEFNQEWFNTNPNEVISIVKALMLSPDEVWNKK